MKKLKSKTTSYKHIMIGKECENDSLGTIEINNKIYGILLRGKYTDKRLDEYKLMANNSSKAYKIIVETKKKIFKIYKQ